MPKKKVNMKEKKNIHFWQGATLEQYQSFILKFIIEEQ